MSMSRLGTGRAKDLADLLRGSGALLMILAMLVGVLAVPVYFLAGFLADLGWSDWLSALCCVAFATTELYVLVLIPEYLDRRDDRREGEATAMASTAPRYQTAAKERDMVAATERVSA